MVSSLLINNGSDPILHSEHYWSITNVRENIPQMKLEAVGANYAGEFIRRYSPK
jgi:hypothetical protein